MKRRYPRGHMTVYGNILPMAAGIARSSFLTQSLTERAKYKLNVIDWWKNHQKNTSLTARHFGLGRATVNRWINGWKKLGMLSLNEKSKRPKRLRAPSTSFEAVKRIVELRKKYKAWSKYKIGAMVRKEGINVSNSTIGRVLKRKNLIDLKISRKKRRSALRPKARFPRGFNIASPGDMIQMDTKHLVNSIGNKLYQFTAIDVLSKRRVLRIYPTQSSRNGTLFLKECFESFPFTIKNIQTDNGAPFQKEFDRFCKDSHIPHYYTYPRSPKQNSYVEISHGADEREFYQQGNTYSILETMRDKIREWENVWNSVRPHAALNYLTPNEYLEKIKESGIRRREIISLQA
jgi:transposase InsO family protein